MSECFMPVEFMDILQPLLPPDTPVGPRGVTAAGTQWRRAAGDLVCFVDRRSAGTIFFLGSWGARDEPHFRRLQRWQENGVWEALPMKLLALLNRDGKLDFWMSSSLTATMVPAPGGRRRHGPQPDGPCQIRHQTPRCWWTATACRWPAAHDGSQRRSDQQQLANHHSQVSSHPGQTGTPRNTPRPPWRIRAMTTKPTATAAALAGNRTSFIAKRRTEHGFRSWQVPMGSGTHQCLAQGLQTHARPLGPLARHSTRLERSRHEHHLLSPLERILALTQTYNNSGFVRAF